MVDWKDYRDQCKADLSAAKSLFAQNDYGNAAYHLQQAVEKYAKGTLFLGKIHPFPLYTHIPLEKIADQLLPAFDKVDKIAKKYKVSVDHGDLAKIQRQYMRQCKRMMKRLKNKKVKIAVWKNSLGIPRSITEQRLLKPYHYFKDYHKFSLNRVVAFSKSDTEGDRFFKRVNADPEVKKLQYNKAVAELGRMMVATYPHEDIGRYPTTIWINKRKQNSAELYKQYKDNLWQLIETVSNTLKL